MSYRLVLPEIAPRPCRRHWNHPFKEFVGNLVMVAFPSVTARGHWITEHIWILVTAVVGRGASMRLVGHNVNASVGAIHFGDTPAWAVVEDKLEPISLAERGTRFDVRFRRDLIEHVKIPK